MGNEIKILDRAGLMIVEGGFEGIKNRISLFLVRRKINSFGIGDRSSWIIGSRNELSEMNEICNKESLNRNGTAFEKGGLFVQRIEN